MNFILGLISDFESIGYSITTERKSIDSTLAIVHVNVLGDKLADIWGDERFSVVKMADLEGLLNSVEWKLG